MTNVDINNLIADGLSKWLWFHRGDKLHAISDDGKFMIYRSWWEHNVGYISLKVCDVQMRNGKLVIPSSKQIDNMIDKQDKQKESEK